MSQAEVDQGHRVVDNARLACAVLKAKGRAEAKMALGISNQAYPEWESKAETELTTMAAEYWAQRCLLLRIIELVRSRSPMDLQYELTQIVEMIPHA